MKVNGESPPTPEKDRSGGEKQETKNFRSGTDNRKTTWSRTRVGGEKKPELPHVVTEISTDNKAIRK